jgi:hypothetical protein
MRVGTAEPPQVSFASVVRSVLAQSGMIGQELVGGRHTAEHRDAVLGDEAQRASGFEALLEDDGPALEMTGSAPMPSEATWNKREIMSATSVDTMS